MRIARLVAAAGLFAAGPSSARAAAGPGGLDSEVRVMAAHIRQANRAYRGVAGVPEVIIVAAAELRDVVYPPQSVGRETAPLPQAFYKPRRGERQTLYVRDDVDPRSGPCAMSIVYHELVHYHQFERMRADPNRSREYEEIAAGTRQQHGADYRIAADPWEKEAYEMQAQWLRDAGATFQFIEPGDGATRWMIANCRGPL